MSPQKSQVWIQHAALTSSALWKKLQLGVSVRTRPDSALITQRSRLSTQQSQLSNQHLQLSTQHSHLSTQHSQLSTHHSQLSTKHSALTTKHSALTPQHTALTTKHSAHTTSYLCAPPRLPYRDALNRFAPRTASRLLSHTCELKSCKTAHQHISAVYEP